MANTPRHGGTSTIQYTSFTLPRPWTKQEWLPEIIIEMPDADPPTETTRAHVNNACVQTWRMTTAWQKEFMCANVLNGFSMFFRIISAVLQGALSRIELRLETSY